MAIIVLPSRTGVGAPIKWWQRGTGFGNYVSDHLQNFDAYDVRYTVFSGVFQYVLPLVVITAIYLKIYHFLKVGLHIKLVYSWRLALSSLSENIIWSNSNNIKGSFPGLKGLSFPDFLTNWSVVCGSLICCWSERSACAAVGPCRQKVVARGFNDSLYWFVVKALLICCTGFNDLLYRVYRSIVQALLICCSVVINLLKMLYLICCKGNIGLLCRMY